MSFTVYKQLNTMDCGPTCIRMIARYYGKYFNADSLRRMAGFNKDGVSLFGLTETAEKIGFRTRGVRITYSQLTESPLPAILHWDRNHFVVLYDFKGRNGEKGVRIADPARGRMEYTKQEFLDHWTSTRNRNDHLVGVALLFEPTPTFYEQEGEKEKKFRWQRMYEYLRQSRWQLIQVFCALLITSLLQLALPFLTQSIVDTGITTKNLHFIVVILIAQLMLTFSRTTVDFIRNRLLLKVSNVLNISILSDFWIKLTRLPVSYFETHRSGDIFQRIGDHRQIQSFLTGSALSTLFSVFNFIIFAIVLISYNALLFLVFCIGSLLYFIWVQVFLRIRRKLNYQTFHLSARENTATLQMIQGMQEIRLNNAEHKKRWYWENIQAMIFKLNFRTLTYGQYQQAGALLINQTKDLTISFLVAEMVVEGQLTLGTMLAVQYIIGQLSSPVEQWVSFVQSAQDARISMERLNEVHQLEDEEPADRSYIRQLPEERGIFINNLSFSYRGAGLEPVLKNISLHIPQGKITAIVGVSGSGKTTLVKLLLKFYELYQGEITIGKANFRYISPSFWRSQCGAVLQDGFIFNDTIAGNIAVGDETIDHHKLIHSCKTANILSFIESLPNGFDTQLGVEGVGISQGQKQRLLIARAVYKEPEYLFFDEATNALDANNEKDIVSNLNAFFEGRTVVIVAHRLSTVRHADKIVVIDKGEIVEEGNHDYLCTIRGKYFQLVRNQLEIGA